MTSKKDSLLLISASTEFLANTDNHRQNIFIYNDNIFGDANGQPGF